MTVAQVQAAIAGDADAFDALARGVGDGCLAIAARILRDPDAAEDAVQQALIQAWRQLPNLRDPERFVPWIHRIVVNACYAEARRHRRWMGRVAEIEIQPSGQDDVARVDDVDQLERAFRRLPIEQRAVLVLHHYLGLPIQDVADRVGIPVGTAKSRLHYGSIALRAAVDADERRSTVPLERLA
jgi:RNA polymerase sigma-70 factor (ECF subfamily)